MMKLNREQIIQALECHANGCKCSQCPMPKRTKEGYSCWSELSQATLAFVKELTKEKNNLEYTLLGVMHSVDKWLDGAELEMDEVNRAITMREKTLQIVENLTEKWEEAINQVNYIADVTKVDTVQKMQERLYDLIADADDVNSISYSQIDQIAKEILED